MVPVAVAIARRDVGTSALVDLSWSVADAAGVVLSNAIVVVVTDAISIGVCHAVTSAHA